MATLGEGDYNVMAMDRGGKVPIGEITGISVMTINMVRDDTGTCLLHITNPSPECCSLLGSLRTVRHEVVVFRNGRRVWEGPITRIGFQSDDVEIEARDITWFMSRRALEVGFDHTGVSYPALTALYDMVIAHYPPGADQYNIGQFVTRIESADDPRTAAVYQPYSRTVFDLLDQYAARSGVDYVVQGRRLLLFGTHTRAHVLPKMTDKHLSGSVNLTEYGSELRTRTVVTNSDGSNTIATAPQEIMDYYGKVDGVDNNMDEAGGEEPNTPEEEAAIEASAEKHLRSEYPAPVRVWIPDNSRLNPCYPAEFEQLIPGAWVPIQAENLCRSFSQWQKMQTVHVSWVPGSESVNISLTKAPDVFEYPTATVSP